MTYAARLHVLARGGSANAGGDTVVVKDADEVVLLLAAAACDGGKVDVNRISAKPAKPIRAALIDLDGDQPHPKSMTTTLQISANSLKIRGRTLDHAVAVPDPTKGIKSPPPPQ